MPPGDTSETGHEAEGTEKCCDPKEEIYENIAFHSGTMPVRNEILPLGIMKHRTVFPSLDLSRVTWETAGDIQEPFQSCKFLVRSLLPTVHPPGLHGHPASTAAAMSPTSDMWVSPILTR